MDARRHNRRSTRRADDSGAVMVEFGLLAPVLVLLSLGLLEFGMAWRQNLYVERSAQMAGRTGASSGADPFTDYDILQSVSSTISGATNTELERVIVFKANTGGTVPASCLSAAYTGLGAHGVAGVCNVYGAAQVFTTSPGVGFARASNATTCGSGWDTRWCPMGRDRTLPGADRIGLYVEAKYTNYTGLLPSPTQTLRTTAVYQLEPTYVGRD